MGVLGPHNDEWNRCEGKSSEFYFVLEGGINLESVPTPCVSCGLERAFLLQSQVLKQRHAGALSPNLAHDERQKDTK